MEVKIVKEIQEYKEALFFGLNLRQCICSLLALLVAVGLYFMVRQNSYPVGYYEIRGYGMPAF